VCGGCRRRRQRGDAPKPAPFATRNNSYRNVILAFGGGAGGDDSATPPPPLPAPSTYSSSCSGGGGGGSPGEVVELGCSNPVTSAPLAAAGECWWEARAWPPPPRPRGAAKLPALVGGALMPIDERLEDLYTAAKQQHQHQQHKQRWRETQQVMRVGLLEVASVRNSQHTHTHTRLTALFRDYPGEPVPER